MSDLSLTLLGNLLAQRLPAAGFEPTAPQGWGAPMPNISLSTLGPGRPRMDADFSIPAFGGNLAVEGNYQRRDDHAPATWAGKLKYNRNF